MKPSEFSPEVFDLTRPDKNMVMIWKCAPGVNLFADAGTGLEQFLFECAYAAHVFADDVAMFKTGGSDNEDKRTFEFDMRRPMPWELACFAIVEHALALWGGEFSPGVHWFDDDRLKPAL